MLGLVLLQGVEQIALVLTSQFGIVGGNGLVETSTVAGNAAAFVHQFFTLFDVGRVGQLGHLSQGQGSRCQQNDFFHQGSPRLLFDGLAFGRSVVGGNVGHLLVGQRRGNGAHGRKPAVAVFVFLQRIDDVLRVLPVDHGHGKNFREGGAITAPHVVAALAGGHELGAFCGIANDVLRVGGRREHQGSEKEDFFHHCRRESLESHQTSASL